MSGIAGFTFEDKKLLKQMCSVLRHRGPDGEGHHIDSGVSLGHTMLNIANLENDRQPIFNEDHSKVLICDGRIYNSKEIRFRLQKLGHKFYTSSDLEVIVHSYEEWGDDCVKIFNGMFSFAIWDGERKTLFLARDRCGIKPLYYAVLEDGSLIFASEIKAILQSERIRREVDLDAFHYFINLRFVPREKTFFKGIKKLLPGHFMTKDVNGVRLEKYWEITPLFKNYSESYLTKSIKEVLEQAVKRQTTIGAPLGISISGGIDSSIVVALASKVSEKPLKTFAMGFGESTDELRDARYISDFYETEHHEIICDQMLKDYPGMIWYADTPKRNLFSYYVAKEASKYVKVVLNGLGGDELFAGYEWKYQFAKDIGNERKSIPAKLKKELGEKAKNLIKYISKYGSVHEVEHIHNLKRLVFMDNNVDLYLLIISLDEVFCDDFLHNIYSKKMLSQKLPAVRDIFEPYFDNNLSFIDQILLADFEVKAVDDFLFVEEAMYMANSVESRAPYLDNESVELAFTIPNRFKFHNNTGKYILKKAMRNILPKKVLEKAKRGFGGNIGIQFSRGVYELAKQMLPEGYAVKERFVEKKYITDVLSFKTSFSLFKHYTVIWDLLAFEIWYRMYILGDQVRTPSLNLNSIC